MSKIQIYRLNCKFLYNIKIKIKIYPLSYNIMKKKYGKPNKKWEVTYQFLKLFSHSNYI